MMGFRISSFQLRRLLALCLLSNFFTATLADLTFAQWGKPCKVPDPTKDELIDQRYECDVSKGLICEKYTQGIFCGCRAGGSLTYDRSSGECRRKVAAECHPVTDPMDFARLPFNRKCHANAECVRYNGTLIGTTEASADRPRLNTPICLCKVGYVATRDLSTCVDPNGGLALRPGLSTLLGSILTFVLGLKVLS